MPTKTASAIWRGNPPNAATKPNPVEIITYLESIENIASGAVAYYEDDLADLPVASGVPDDVFALVLNDATVSSRGVYQEQSDAWVWIGMQN